MNQTGSGALSKDDVEILRSGYIIVVPRPSGGILALFDESRLQRTAEDAKLRIIFYFSSLYSEYAAFGKTIIHVVTSAMRPGLDLNTQEWQIRKKAMPGSGLVKPKTIVAQAYEEGKQDWIDYLAHRTLSIEEFKTQMRPQRIARNSARNTLALLEEQGLERSLLPRCLGGDFDYDQFDEWIRVHLTIEGGMSAAPLHHLNHLHVQEENSTPQPQEEQTLQKDDQISAKSLLNIQGMQTAAQYWQPQHRSRISGQLDPQGPRMVDQLWLPRPAPYVARPLPRQLHGSMRGQDPTRTATPQQLAAQLPQTHPSPNGGQSFHAFATFENSGPPASHHPNPTQAAPQTSQTCHHSKKHKPDAQNNNSPGTKKHVRTYVKRNKKLEDLKEESKRLRALNEKLRENNRELENCLAQVRLLAAIAEAR